MDLELGGRTAFISGATKGIGAAVAEALAAEGVDLFLVARSREALARTADDLSSRYRIRVAWSDGDLSVAGEGERAAKAALSAFAAVDVIVNNAGQSMPGSLETTAAEWATSNQLNFLAHLEVMRTLLPDMRQRGWGRVVNIVGMSYRHPTDLSTGTIAKYGLIATSQIIARDVAADGVTINSVTIGLIETPQIAAMLGAAPDRRAATIKQIPMGRLGLPTEVANGVLFFASPRASYATASTITIDGGADISLL